MNIPKRFAVIALMALALTSTVRATLWTGTITETVTTSTDPAFFVGQVIIGSYQYASTTVDGVFLYGEFDAKIFGFFQQLPEPGWIDMSWGLFNSLTRLEVSNGVVVDFLKTGEVGPWDFGFTESNFGSYYTYSKPGSVVGYAVNGTIVFAPPASVPDGGATVAMLALGMVAVASFKARKKR